MHMFPPINTILPQKIKENVSVESGSKCNMFGLVYQIFIKKICLIHSSVCTYWCTEKVSILFSASPEVNRNISDVSWTKKTNKHVHYMFKCNTIILNKSVYYVIKLCDFQIVKISSFESDRRSCSFRTRWRSQNTHQWKQKVENLVIVYNSANIY